MMNSSCKPYHMLPGYTNLRAVKARDLQHAKQRAAAKQKRFEASYAKAKGMLLAQGLKVVVCPPESFGGWDNANAVCVSCGEGVWCEPLCEGVEVKLCVKCAVEGKRRLLFN